MWLMLVALSLAPGAFWGWWFYRKDVYEKEPFRLLALVFIVAAPLSFVAGVIEYILDGGSDNTLSGSDNILLVALFYIGVVGILEEGVKFLAVRLTVYRNAEFNEPVDGIIYAAAAALGFATFENFFYLLNAGPLVIILRGPVSTLGHILFSAMWGYALGFARFEPNPATRRRLVFVGFLYAVLTHGVFDILISLGQILPDYTWLSLSGVLFVVGLYFVVSRQIGAALRLSQFRPDLVQARVMRQARERLAQFRTDRYPVQLPLYPTGDHPAPGYGTPAPGGYPYPPQNYPPQGNYPPDAAPPND